VRGKLDREAAGLSSEDAAVAQRPLGWAEAWRAAASIKTLRTLWFAIPFSIAGALQLQTLINLYYTNVFHVPTLTRGLIVSFSLIPGLIGVVIGGAFADRLLAYKPGRLITYLSGIGV